MPVAHDLSKIWIALRTAMLADADLVALLADGESIYREDPAATIKTPAIILRDAGRNPRPGDTFTGRWRPELKIDILTDDEDAGQAIAGYLESAWSIPIERPDAVESAYLRLDEFRSFSSAASVGRVQLQSSGQSVWLTSVFWVGRVILRAES